MRAIAWCIEAHDLILAKLARGEQRDWDFARDAIKANLVEPDKLIQLIPTMPVAGDARGHIHDAVVGITASLG